MEYLLGIRLLRILLREKQIIYKTAIKMGLMTMPVLLIKTQTQN